MVAVFYPGMKIQSGSRALQSWVWTSSCSIESLGTIVLQEFSAAFGCNAPPISLHISVDKKGIFQMFPMSMSRVSFLLTPNSIFQAVFQVGFIPKRGIITCFLEALAAFPCLVPAFPWRGRD